MDTHKKEILSFFKFLTPMIAMFHLLQISHSTYKIDFPWSKYFPEISMIHQLLFKVQWEAEWVSYNLA